MISRTHADSERNRAMIKDLLPERALRLTISPVGGAVTLVVSIVEDELVSTVKTVVSSTATFFVFIAA